MKSIKKILTTILVVAILATMIVVPAGATTMTDAQKVSTLGILRGDSSAGVTAEYLSKSTNRSQGARVLLRLRGLESEADAFTGTSTFTDSRDATAYWQPMLAYLKANPNAGFSGYPDGTFLPNKIMTAQELYKVLLVALGYVENVDFTWNQVFTFAASKGLTKLQGKQNVTNNDLAVAMVEALGATKKDGQKLIAFLVQEEVITVDKAQQAGFNVVASVQYAQEYTATIGQPAQLPAKLNATLADGTVVEVNVTWSTVNTATLGPKTVTGNAGGFVFTTTVNVVPDVLTITDAFPTGVKEITVTLSKAAPQSVPVTLKMGNVTQSATVEFDSTRRVVKLTRTWNFFPGQYSVTVGDSTKQFNIAEEQVTQVLIGANYIFPLANQDLDIKLLNQYNEAMMISNTTIHVTNITRGTTVPFTTIGTQVKADASNNDIVRSGDSLMVMVIHHASTKHAEKRITVYDKPTIKGLQFGELEIANNKTRIEAGTSGHKFKLHAVDQYGNPYTLSSNDIGAGGQMTILSSNHAVINPSSFSIDFEGKLTFNASAAGTCTITLLVPTSGVIVFNNVQVVDPASISGLTIFPPGTMITAGKRAEFNFVAYDQFGNTVSSSSYDHNKFSFTSTNTNVIPNQSILYDASKGVLYTIPNAVGTTQITYYYEGRFMNALSITVNEAPKPASITAINIPQAFETTATRTIPITSFTVKDQYGQDFDFTSSNYRIQLEEMNTSLFTITNGSNITTSSSATLSAKNVKGTAAIRATVINTTTGQPITSSVREIQVEVVTASDITTYSFENVPTMYAGGSGATNYYRTLVINGRTASGKTVQLAGSGGKPSAIEVVTSTNSDIVIANQDTLQIYATKAGTSTIRAWRGGVAVAQVTVTASEETPRIATGAFASNTHTVAKSTTFTVTSLITVKDQYGVVIPSPSILFLTSDATVATVNNTNGTVTTTSKGGSITITAISANGEQLATLNLIVQ